MSIKLCTPLLCCLFFLADSCHSRLGGNQSSSPANALTSPSATEASRKPAFDACRLLSSSEIEAIQGVRVQETQPTTQKHFNLDFSQCYYMAHTADGSKNLSVYVQVIQRDPESANLDAVKEFWNERFRLKSKEKRRAEKEEEEKERGEEEEEAIGPPVAVPGIGEEAFWLASDRGGALYVLTNNRVVRVSAGGPNDAKNNLEKPKALAKKIVERLM